ncbi:MAG: phosphoenolpyruvate carboxykinase domain-containing protein, partial [Acidimicrobiia bacterium]
DWRGRPWDPASGEPAAHPNARFTVPAQQCPVVAPEWEDPAGVPISAILFGGRRATNVPLVTESFDWEHGVFLGSIMSSETTAAQAGAVGKLRFDPFAMLPFCGYNMADYIGHWLATGAQSTPEALPKFFYVNWFRKSPEGKWLWPGFGENSRVLEWIFQRVNGEGEFVDTPIGRVPTKAGINTQGLDLSDEDLDELLKVDAEDWRKEVPSIKEHFDDLGERLPAEMWTQLHNLEQRLT